MLINKTVDECIIETGGALFQCLVDKNLTVAQKKMCIEWLVLFFNYQDAIITDQKEKITDFQKQLTTNFTTSYYYKAFQEFNAANIIYPQITNLTDFKKSYQTTTDKEIKTIISEFAQTFNIILATETSTFGHLNLAQINDNLLILFIAVYYHLGYHFKEELLPIIKNFATLIKTPLFIAHNDSHVKILLLKKVLQDNEDFFNDIEPIQLRNFIHSLDDIFTNGLNITNKIERLILTKPHKLKCSMNMLLSKYGIHLPQILWKNDEETNPIPGNMIMHLFAYETYYVQRNHNYDVYEKLVLNNVLVDPLYQQIFVEYKKQNNINKII